VPLKINKLRIKADASAAESGQNQDDYLSNTEFEKTFLKQLFNFNR